jgi:hypothetical protein
VKSLLRVFGSLLTENKRGTRVLACLERTDFLASLVREFPSL